MGIYDEQIVSAPEDLLAVDMDLAAEMIKAVLAGQTFDESGIADTPTNRRVYAVKEHNVAVMRKYGMAVDIPFANFMGLLADRTASRGTPPTPRDRAR